MFFFLGQTPPTYPRETSYNNIGAVFFFLALQQETAESDKPKPL
jgi:hypothetical protein